MPKRQIIELHPKGWENDPADEFLKLAPLDYCVAQVYTNWALFFKLSDSEDRQRIADTLQRGLEVTLSQCRQLCGHIEEHPDGGLCFHKKRESTVEFHVQWLDGPEDEGQYPSFEDLEKNHFLTQSLGDINTWCVSTMTYGEKPEARPKNRPKASAFKASFIPGGMVFMMHHHHYCNDINGWAGELYQLADNCAALWKSPESPQYPPWDPACLDYSRVSKPDPEQLVEGPPCPDEHPDHVEGQWLLFHLPKSKAAELKKMASPEDGSYWISSYDAYTTYIWRMLSKHRAKLFKTDLTKNILWGEAVNMRTRLGDPPLPKRIQGNIVQASLSMTSSVPQFTAAEVISEAPFPKLAWYNRQLTNSATPENLDATINQIVAVRDKTALAMRLDSFPPLSNIAGDWRESKPYEADFGFAKPYVFRHPFDRVTNGYILIYPTRTNGGPAGADEGNEILIGFEKEIAKNLLQDPEWNRFFEFRGVDREDLTKRYGGNEDFLLVERFYIVLVEVGTKLYPRDQTRSDAARKFNINRAKFEGQLRWESFENIYLDLSKQSGKCKLAESGMGWRPSGGGDTFTLDSSNIAGAQWSRAAKGYELKILSRTSGVIQLDGFEQEDFDRTSKAFKIWYGINVDQREHALRGWNWGKADFGKGELAFNVQNRPAFEIPYSEVSNTNLAGRNEVAVEFSLPTDAATNGTNGATGSTKNRGRKAGAGRDELVEMRFYIPGTVAKTEKGEDEEKSDAEDVEEQNAANLFYETLMDKAEIGDVAGDTFATFLDVLHLTPRGRFDIDMYESSFRLRGKTYDYKIQYQSIKKFFLLPKNDDTHTLITLGLDPPLRQGQTRYPFLVMQLKLDEEISIDLNMTEELLESRYKDKLEAHYEEPIHQVVTKVFRGLSGKKIIMPSRDFVSHHGHSGVKCSIKANEGLLFCLDKSFMFVPKPATYVQIENISVIKMSRVGGAVSASRTFDITMTLKNGAGEHQFSNINREEQQSLEAFFKSKNIRFKNEMADDSSALIAAALDNEDMASSEDEGGAARADRGSADEDSESVDEDFQADSESDVAEEYDSEHESSGSDAEMEDAGDADEEERPKKKSKTG